MAQKTLIEPPYVALLSSALSRKLKGAEVDAERIRNDRYRFVVVWGRFDRMGHPERQQLVWDIAEEALEPRDLLKVGMILTLGLEDLPADR